MKKLSRLLPVLILLLFAVYLFLPSQSDSGAVSGDAGTSTVASDTLQAVNTASSRKGTSQSGQTGSTAQPASGQNAKTETSTAKGEKGSDQEEEELLPEDGSYTTKEDVSLYLVQYGHLPSNFITKKEAQKAGWSGGSLEKVLPGMCIGGDYFGNYEGLLPKAKGRTWTECDIDTLGARSRGAKRLIFSNDGLIYYTDDHYESFTQLY